MQSLKDLWLELHAAGYGSDKGDIHSYIDVYEELFAPYRETALNILEIGIFKGDSLRLFQKYFTGNVYGVDCSETPIDGMADLRPIIAEGKHNIRILDATDKEAIKKAFKGIKFDVVIEDAQHYTQQQLDIYNAFKSFIAPGGIYIIEDAENIDRDRSLFENIDPEKKVEIVDRRKIKDRFDDVLVVIR